MKAAMWDHKKYLAYNTFHISVRKGICFKPRALIVQIRSIFKDVLPSVYSDTLKGFLKSVTALRWRHN